jgi:carbonic anhydrase
MPIERFGTVINCIDGRAQRPVTEWMQRELGVAFSDRITEPGPDLLLAAGEDAQLEAVRRKVELSVRAHQSTVVAVVGHHDCAANPASREEHLAQIRAGITTVEAWGLPVLVVGLWVNEHWEVEPVCRRSQADASNGQFYDISPAFGHEG